jgi:hypothetical protein
MKTKRGMYINPTTSAFVRKMTSELIHKGGQSIILYRVNPTMTNQPDLYGDLYNESTVKKFYNPIEIPCFVYLEKKSTSNFEEVGQERTTTINVYILREYLKSIDILPQNGDVISYMQMFFEIYNVDDSEQLHGDPRFRYAINIDAHQIRRNKYEIPIQTDF